MTDDSVTMAEFARRRGFSKQYAHRLKAAGRLVMVNGLVDVQASINRIASTGDARYPSKAVSSPPTLDDAQSIAERQAARAMKEEYLAKRAKLNYERESALFVSTEEVKLYAAELGAIFRAALEVLPDRLTPEIVPLSDTESIRALLVEQFDQVLNDLANHFSKPTCNSLPNDWTWLPKTLRS